MINATLRTAGRLARRLSHARDLRRRRVPEFRTRPAGPGTGPATVYYLTPDEQRPTGGVRNLYRHVDLLNAAGVESAVVHTRAGFRCRWFENQTRVMAAAQVALTPDDVLVVPESYGPWLHRLPRGPRVVIFNQGPYYTFDPIPFAGSAAGAPYSGIEGLVALLTVSEDGEALLRWTFPDLPVHRARVVVDGARFHPDGTPRERRIAYLPRSRRSDDREQLLHMLRARGVLDGWQLVPIQGMTETELAGTLRGCPIFLSFSHREGFGLPPAEAMASGCYVVGFTGMGGKEFFDPAYCAPVPEGDLTAYAAAVQAATERYDKDPEELAELGRTASQRVLARYREAGLRADLARFYQPLLAARDRETEPEPRT
jgi:hypothetical protein